MTVSFNAHRRATLNLRSPPNSALQRTAISIKCSAAGEPASCAHQSHLARVLKCRRAVAELGS